MGALNSREVKPLKTQKPSPATWWSLNHQNEEVDREMVCSCYSAHRLWAGLQGIPGSQGLPGHRGGKHTAAQAHMRVKQMDILTISTRTGALISFYSHGAQPSLDAQLRSRCNTSCTRSAAQTVPPGKASHTHSCCPCYLSAKPGGAEIPQNQQPAGPADAAQSPLLPLGRGQPNPLR